MLDATNGAIVPDKMLSLLVYLIKKHMESYFPDFSAEDKSEAPQIVQNQFFCTSACVNTRYLFHL